MINIHSIKDAENRVLFICHECGKQFHNNFLVNRSKDIRYIKYMCLNCQAFIYRGKRQMNRNTHQYFDIYWNYLYEEELGP